MKSWWISLTARERTLIALAVVVAVVAALIQVAIAPLHAERARAQAAYAEALGVLDEVRGGVAQAEAARPSSASAMEGPSLRLALTASATQRGLSISRIEPLEDGGFSLRFDAADPAVFYEWLSHTSESTGAHVREAILRRDGQSGVVQATLVLEEGRS